MPMHLFVTADGVANSGSHSLGWEAVHKGPLYGHDASGEHESMVTEPHVSHVVAMLMPPVRTAHEAQA